MNMETKKKICPKCGQEDGSGLWVLLMEDFFDGGYSGHDVKGRDYIKEGNPV